MSNLTHPIRSVNAESPVQRKLLINYHVTEAELSDMRARYKALKHKPPESAIRQLIEGGMVVRLGKYVLTYDIFDALLSAERG